MILTGRADRADGKADRADGCAARNGRPQAAAASGMASEVGSSQHSGPVQQHSACRRVAVIVDGSTASAPTLRQAASQARQRNASLDVICLLPEQADARAVTLARVRLAEFSRRACPYGVGAPVRLRVELGDLDTVRPIIQAEVELLVTVPAPDIAANQAAQPTAHRAAPHWHLVSPHGSWLHTLLHAPS
jgi:universal stress protein family protein